MTDHSRSDPDVVVLVASWPAALWWATRNGYRRPLFPHSVADLSRVGPTVPVYADLSLWDHARAESLVDWLTSRLRASEPVYEHRAWVDKHRQ